MKQRLKPVAMSLLLLGVISTPAWADPSAEQEQIQRLEQNVNQLQSELRALKANRNHKRKPQVYSQVPAQDYASTQIPDGIPQPQHQVYLSGQSFPTLDPDVPGKSFVSTGPYIGVPFVYSGGDLIINTPSVNQDVALLNVRKAIHNKMVALGRAGEADHAHLLLSGIVEGQASYNRPGTGSGSSDVNLSGAELDGYILGPSNWTSGLFSFSYDDASGPSEGTFNNNARTQTSRVYLNKAFITIGDFTRTPFYGSIGQMYVPFGTYSSSMISSPLTKAIGRTKARAVVVGYQQQAETNAFYGAGYIFRGDTQVGSSSSINNGGVNLGYRFSAGNIHGDVGGGVIANLADAGGMQNNGNIAPLFGGFGAVGNGSEILVHRVPGVDVRGTLSVGDHLDILGEYVGALQSFSMTDMTMNNHGAKPQAINTQAAYTFSAFDKPSSVAIGYGRTKDALALGLPAQRYLLGFSTSWWKDTLQSLEFRHDVHYAASNFATGNGATVTQNITGPGVRDNAVTAQMDIYF